MNYVEGMSIIDINTDKEWFLPYAVYHTAYGGPDRRMITYLPFLLSRTFSCLIR